MRTIRSDLLLAILFGLVFPGILLNLLVFPRKYPTVTEFTHSSCDEPVEKVEISIRVRFEDGAVTEMDMDSYLVGVVLAELPASFEQEAKRIPVIIEIIKTHKLLKVFILTSLCVLYKRLT